MDYSDDPDHQKFLSAISQIESSGGKNTNYPVITSGVSKGERAVGNYGLTPDTLDTLNVNNKTAHTFGPDQNITNQLDNNELGDFMKNNPRVDDNYAQQNANKLFKKAREDDDQAAAMWNKGYNVKPSQLDPDALDQNDYVQKFRKLKQMLRDKYAE